MPPTQPSADWLQALASQLGPEGLWIQGVNAAAHDLAPHERDWRGRYQGRALAMARPCDVDEVVAVVKACSAHGVAIVPQGGNTGLVGGSIPDGSGQQMLLNLQRMNRVLGVDAANLSMAVQAGCTLAQVQGAAEAAGLLFPLSLAAEGSCTIGGNLATNAGGTQVLRYGTARELCLGLEVVTPQGDIWQGLSALRKNNTGYNLRDLYIGSEGTLGIITAATLRLHPRPASQQTALAACDSLQACVGLLSLARQQLDAQLTAFEAMGRLPIELMRHHLPNQARAADDLGSPPWVVLIETSHPRALAPNAVPPLQTLLEQALAEGTIRNATLSQTDAQHRAMWALREGIPSAEKLEGLMVKHDIAVPTSQIPALVQQASTALERAVPGHQLVCFGHLGDGNLHFNVGAPKGSNQKAFVALHERAINTLVYDVVIALGGTISAEHGIGSLKRDEMAQRQSPVALSLMKAIKQALDPRGLMNPGRVL